jgi:hypothetical protein
MAIILATFVRWHSFSLAALFERAEAEQAAALLIDVLRTNGDVWRPTSSSAAQAGGPSCPRRVPGQRGRRRARR